jgi:pilus assembly protein CpaE
MTERKSNMSDLSSSPERKGWQPGSREAAVQLYLSVAEGNAGDLLGARAGGWPLELNLVAATDWIDVAELAEANCAVVQVDADSPASIKRVEKLAAALDTPLIAASFEPPLALVRALIRAGAHDVVPLPLQLADLETSLQPLRERVAKRRRGGAGGRRKLVTVIKGEGGVGATSLLGQLAIRFAARESAAGREACLLDLDVQFGDAAFQLGLQPPLTVSDLVDAGARLDGALLRATTTAHPSGLAVLAAPRQIMPLETLNSEQALQMVDNAMREFGTVFLDLPHNWTNWSLSLLARADTVLLVTELRIASLHRARRQLDLIASQDLGELDVRVVINRAEKGLFRSIKATDVERVLGRPISYTVANDHETMSTAIERGVPVAEIRRRGPLARDLEVIAAGVAETLAVEA